MFELPIISISIFMPLFSAIYIMFFTGRGASRQLDTHIIYVALLSCVLTLICTIYLYGSFDTEIDGFQFVEHYNWVNAIGLNFHVGIDGISIYFIVLSALLTTVCIINSLFTVKKFTKEYIVCFLLLEALCIGAFSSLNLLLFFIFFEVILIPMYIIIGVFGGENRVYSAVKFFLYTFFGSVFLLISIIYIYSKTATFDMTRLPELVSMLSIKEQKILWLATFVSFAIKIPMIPFHTWLPDAHVQAPTAGSVMLAGILLKLGGYAMLRISLPMLPDATNLYADNVLMFSAVAIIYASFVALAQTDMKKMIAYSSIAHMGYVTAGIFSLNSNGINGAVLQMISHGIISAALFMMIGMLYERGKTKEIARYGGVASSMPIFSSIFMVAMLASIGLPGTSGFVGEFLAIIGTFESSNIIGSISAFGVVLGAVYMLKLYRCICFGQVSNEQVSSFHDLYINEKIALTPLVILIIFIGLVPSSILEITEIPVSKIINFYN